MANQSSAEEIFEGVSALKCLFRGSGCTDSDALPSKPPSDENECQLLFHQEGQQNEKTRCWSRLRWH